MADEYPPSGNTKGNPEYQALGYATKAIGGAPILDPDQPLPKELATLERWTGERVKRHRAMLLWAMQAPGERSKRAVGRALGMVDGTVRKYAKRGRWSERLPNEGSDAIALALYRELYIADFGAVELKHVARNVRLPMAEHLTDDPDGQAMHEAGERARDVAKRANQATKQAAAQALQEHQRDRKADADKHIKLIDASLGLVAKRVVKGEVRVTLRDIPVLLEYRERLVQIAGGNAVGTNGVVLESARLKHAKETGGDIVAAMHEDALELCAILGTMRGAQGVDRSQVWEQHQAHQDPDSATG
jgi:hypothetical protein